MTPAVSVIEMGPQSIRERWCAHAFGHPGCVVVDMLAGATTRSRPPIDVRCGLAHEAFEPRHVERAVYATRWDGSVVATFGTDGAIAVAAAGR